MKVPELKHDPASFAGLLGGFIRLCHLVKVPLHVVSFVTGIWFLYSFFRTQAESFDLLRFDLTLPAIVILGVLAASIIEILHFSAPDLFFRMAFEPRKQLTSAPTIFMFVLLGGVVYGLTRISQVTSSGGAEQAAAATYTPPPPTDISADALAFQQDSARIASTAEQQAEAVRLEYQGKISAASAKAERRIAGLRAKLSKHRQDKAKGNQWAQGWIDRRTVQIQQAKAERLADIEALEADRAAALAPILSQKATTLADLSGNFRNYRLSVRQSDGEALAAAKSSNERLKSLASHGGVNIVWWILAISFLCTFYDVFSGNSYHGGAFRSSRRLSRAWSALIGMAGDKYDHQVTRLEVTRDHLRQRNEAQPYALPKGKYILIGVLVAALAFFVSATIPFGDTTTAEMTFVPFPWNWTGLILCILSLVLTGWRPQWSVRGSAPEAVEQSTSVTDADIREQVELLTMSLSYCDAGERPGIGEQIELLELSLMI